MATIASLAIKVAANVSDLTKGISSINSSIGYMVKTAQNASPSLKSLEDVAKGAGAMMDAVAAAQKRVNDNPVDIESQMVLTKTQEAAAKLKTELNRIGSGIAGDILNMTPTISNLQKAQQEVQKLKETFGETSPIVAEAQKNVGELAAKTAQTQMQMEGLKTVIFAINNAPFMLLGSIFKDLWQGITDLGSGFNKHFSGVPGVILKVSAVITSLIVVIGLANTQMLALNGSVTYFKALWEGSIIAQGLRGFITMLNTMLGTQLALNAATMLWIGMITLGVAALVAAVYLLYQRWTDNSAAIAASASRVDALKDKMEQVVESAKRINDSMRSTLNELMSPLDKYKNKLDEIKKAGEQKITLAADMKDVSFEMQDIALKMSKTKNESAIAAYSGQISELQKQFKALKEQQKISASFSDADIAAAKAKALEDYRSSLGVVKTDAENLAEQTKKLSEGLAAGAINQNEFNSLLKAAKEKYDPIVKAEVESLKMLEEEYAKELKDAEELAKMELDARKQLAAKFIDMGKSEQDKHSEMLAQLESVKNMMKPEQYGKALAALEEQSPAIKMLNEEYAKELKAAEELAKSEADARKQLIDKFRQMANDSPSGKFNELKTQLDSVRSALSADEFRVAADKMKSDLASGLGIAEFLKPEQSSAEKLNEIYKKLEQYAELANDPFFDLAAAKQRAADKLTKDDKKTEKQANNAALERGTAAYLAMVNNANNPQLQEQKRQTKIQQQIANNTKQSGDKLEITQVA